MNSASARIVRNASAQTLAFHNRSTWTDQFFYLGATPFAKYQGNVTYFIHGNHLGSTTMVYNHTGGTVVQDEIFYPWGERWAYGGTLYDERFASLGRRDAESTLDPTLFRMYESRLNRWLAPDPLAGGITNPQSLNRYAYVLNNPCNLIDPLGLDNCNFNVTLNNQAGLTSDQVNAIEQRIDEIFGATKSANGDTVGINFGGPPDASLDIKNAGSLITWLHTSGRLTIWGYEGGLFGATPSLYWNVVQSTNPQGATTFAGSYGAHEIAHRLLGVGDLGYDSSAKNIMMFDKAPVDAQYAALLDPNSSMWSFTPGQIGTLFQKCQDVRRGRGGGGAGPRGGGSGGGIIIWDPTYTYACQGGECGFTFGAYWGTYIPRGRPRRK